MLRFLPGLAGAAGAFIALKLIAPIISTSLLVEVIVFAVIYVVITLLIDRAMSRYGR